MKSKTLKVFSLAYLLSFSVLMSDALSSATVNGSMGKPMSHANVSQKHSSAKKKAPASPSTPKKQPVTHAVSSSHKKSDNSNLNHANKDSALSSESEHKHDKSLKSEESNESENATESKPKKTEGKKRGVFGTALAVLLALCALIGGAFVFFGKQIKLAALSVVVYFKKLTGSYPSDE